MRQVKWNLRDDCKQEQVPSVFSAVMRMQETFNYQETEQWEREPSNTAHQPVPAYLLMPDGV